jgi:hypothetical protein
MLTCPTRNLIAGGKIVGAKQCVRFTGASGSQIKEALLSRCAVGVSSTAGSGRTVSLRAGQIGDQAKLWEEVVPQEARSFLPGWASSASGC